jgi:hypothetical protein
MTRTLFTLHVLLFLAAACDGNGHDDEDADGTQDPVTDQDSTTDPASEGDPAADTPVDGDPPGDDVAPPDSPDLPDLPPDTELPPGECMAGDLVSSLGRDHILVGGAMEDETASLAPFDLRYRYLAGGIFDGDEPCASCAEGCTAGGQSCANAAGGCGWWGCWQWDADPPGQYLRNHLQSCQGSAQIPMVTYYEILQASGVGEGAPEVEVAGDAAFMRRYFADWRFVLQTIGSSAAIVHHEPDFWGYAEHYANEHSGGDPHGIAAAVASANPTDCGGMENTIAGLGQCLIAMARTYAPAAKVGLHASGWGTGMDALYSGDGGFDVAAEARTLAGFLGGCGASGGDLIIVDASDRDAGYAESVGQDRWWDDTNGTLPNFTRAFEWARALTDALALPVIWWQMPLGNMSLPNVTDQWHDNKLDYFFDHTGELAGCNTAGMAFGAGIAGQTTPESDGGHFVGRVQAYIAAGGQDPCP